MFKPVPVGDRTRYSYARINEILAMPHLIDIQRKSYEWFVQKGLMEILHDISPIKDFAGNLELSFESFELGTPKYSVEECKERDESYSAPMNVKARLIFKDKEKGEIYFKTDNDELFEESIEYFKEEGFEIIKITHDLHSEMIFEDIRTEHEQMFSEQGIKIKALIAKIKN